MLRQDDEPDNATTGPEGGADGDADEQERAVAKAAIHEDEDIKDDPSSDRG